MTALRSAIALFAAAFVLPAVAMQLDPDDRGEMLIYPYFTAQDSGGNAFNTYISIVNDSGSAKALRVRFREGRNGRELISFNLLLEGQGTWTAAVVPGAAGAGFVTTDLSCTAPGPLSAVAFSSDEYTGAFDDGLGFDAARQREGYVEVFEMASVGSNIGCEAFRDATASSAPFQRPTGGLSGTLTLINVQSGLDFTVNANAISDFATAPYFRPPGDPYPDYDAAEIAPVAVIFHGDDHLYRTTWNTPLQAINALLMSQTLENDVVMDRGTASGTDFVVSMPTRRLTGDNPPFKATRQIPFDVYFADREGESLHVGDECDFLCWPGEKAHLVLPANVSVVSLRASGSTGTSNGAAGVSDVLGSRNAWLVDLPTTAQNGWASLLLDDFTLEAPFPLLHHRIYPGTGTSVDARPTFWGLPALGFAVRTFRNGNLQCGSAVCQGNYGGAFPHKYKRVAFPP